MGMYEYHTFEGKHIYFITCLKVQGHDILELTLFPADWCNLHYYMSVFIASTTADYF